MTALDVDAAPPEPPPTDLAPPEPAPPEPPPTELAPPELALTGLPPTGPQPSPGVSRWWARIGSVEALVVVILLVVAGRALLVGLFDGPRALALATVFLSLLLQALPFLVVGTLMTSAIRSFVPSAIRRRALRHDAVAFLATSPAISPVVLTATAVAFPGKPMLVVARAVAGLLAALVAGYLGNWLGRPRTATMVAPRTATMATPRTAPTVTPPSAPTMAEPAAPSGRRRWDTFVDSSRSGLIRGIGVLVVSAAAVAVLAAALPVRWLDTLAAFPAVAIGAAALFAVLISPRPETDAVLVAALPQFSLTSRLVFLVVGPVVNLRRFSWQSVRLGPGFALRHAPATLAATVAIAALVGGVLL